MITSHDHLEGYKKAVRLHYELAKKGDYSSFLITPSRAKLRDLCVELFMQQRNADDLRSFQVFFGFDFSIENLNKLRNQKDRFRPIETFFKGETDLTTIEGINIAAILVDYTPRPFLRYIKQHSDFRGDGCVVFDGIGSGEEVPAMRLVPTPNVPRNVGVGKGLLSRFSKKRLASSLLFLGTLGAGFSIGTYVFPSKQCMQWQEDHYEVVVCVSEAPSLWSTAILPLADDLLDFRKVAVDTSTVFFKHGKPLYWYCKVGGKPEFFNSVGDGRHPETGGALKPVSKYIVSKYVLEKE